MADLERSGLYEWQTTPDLSDGERLMAGYLALHLADTAVIFQQKRVQAMEGLTEEFIDQIPGTLPEEVEDTDDIDTTVILGLGRRTAALAGRRRAYTELSLAKSRTRTGLEQYGKSLRGRNVQVSRTEGSDPDAIRLLDDDRRRQRPISSISGKFWRATDLSDSTASVRTTGWRNKFYDISPLDADGNPQVVFEFEALPEDD